MTTPTTNPVPSSAAADLLYNAERMDEALNSSLASFSDRFGVGRLTVAGAMARVAATNPRGSWTTATTYQPRDVVVDSGTWYICIDAHTSGGTFAGDLSAHWRVYQGEPRRISPDTYGADITGATDCSAAFAAAFAAAGGETVHGTPGAIYLIKDVVLDSRKFVGNGCVIRPASGARWVIKLRGYQPEASGFVLQDSDDYTYTTTLSAGESISDTALAVTSATGIEAGQVLLQDVDASASWQLTTVASVAGSTVNIRDGLVSAAASGKTLHALFGALWVEDALWWKIDAVQVVNARGALLIKPSSGGLSNYGSLTRFNVDGARHFGIVKQGDAAGVKAADVKLWCGYTEVTNATGNGTAGPFTFSTSSNCYLKRDLTVTVAGVEKTTPTHWTFTTGKTISFTAGNEPANGAAIVMSHFKDSQRGFVEDQRSTSIISGGNHYHMLEVLDAMIGVHCMEAELTNFSALISDTNSFVALQMDTCPETLSIDSAFLGYSLSSMKLFASIPSIKQLYTKRVPSADTVAGTTDDNIYLDATTTLEMNCADWTGGDYQVAGPGAVNFAAGRDVQFFSSAGSTIAPGATRYMTAVDDFAALPVQMPMVPRATHALEMIVQCGTVPGAGQTFTYTLMINGVASALTAVIADTGSFQTVGRGPVSVAKGDALSVRVVASASAALSTHRALVNLR